MSSTSSADLSHLQNLVPRVVTGWGEVTAIPIIPNQNTQLNIKFTRRPAANLLNYIELR